MVGSFVTHASEDLKRFSEHFAENFTSNYQVLQSSSHFKSYRGAKNPEDLDHTVKLQMMEIRTIIFLICSNSVANTL